MSFTDVRNTDIVIDSRDVIERLEELTEEADELSEAINDAQDALDSFGLDDGDEHALIAALDAATRAVEDWRSEYGHELAALQALAKEGEEYSEDWGYGSTLIRHDYFTEYCQELVQDCDGLPKGIPAYLVIDWNATANNLKVDYTEIDFDGVPYYIR